MLPLASIGLVTECSRDRLILGLVACILGAATVCVVERAGLLRSIEQAAKVWYGSRIRDGFSAAMWCRDSWMVPIPRGWVVLLRR